MAYWLFKSEPDVYSFADLEKEKDQTCFWEGVRNYQARNFLRDRIKKGDSVLFYHSRAKPMAVVGTAQVVRQGYPDHTQFDPVAKYHDAGSKPDDPRWYMVDIRLRKRFARPVTLDEIKETAGLENMYLIRRGMRLSIQPVTAEEWKIINRLGSRKAH